MARERTERAGQDGGPAGSGAVRAAVRPLREDRGPVRYGPPAPDPGLPVLPELADVLAAAAGRGEPEPTGGGEALREAAAAYWIRRGLRGGPQHIAAAPGASPLLLALIAAHGGDVLMPRPCPPPGSRRPGCWAGPPTMCRPRPSAAACPIRMRSSRPYAECAPRAADPGFC